MPAFANPGDLFAIFIAALDLQIKRALLKSCLSSTSVFVTYKKVKSFLRTYYRFECNNMKYTISSQNLYNVIPPGQFSSP